MADMEQVEAEVRRAVAEAKRNILNYEASVGIDLAYSLSDPINWTIRPGVDDYVREGRDCGRFLDFGRHVDAIIEKRPCRNRFLPIAMGPTEIMRRVGFPDIPVIMTPSHARDAMTAPQEAPAWRRGHVHDIDPLEFKRLPECMREPLAIFEQSRKMSATVLLLELADRRGNPIIMPVDAYSVETRTQCRVPSNFTKTTFGRRQIASDLDEAHRRGTLLYLDARRVEAFLDDLGMQPPRCTREVDGLIARSKVCPRHEQIYRKALEAQLKGLDKVIGGPAEEPQELEYQPLRIYTESFNLGA